MEDLFKSLDIDKGEWMEAIEHGDSSSASFLACVEECISERESRRFEEGLNMKVKLDIYKRFGKSVKFKKFYMEYVMLEVDFYFSLGRVLMV